MTGQVGDTRSSLHIVLYLNFCFCNTKPCTKWK